MKKKIFIGISIFYFLPLMLTILQGCKYSCGNIKQSSIEITNMYLVNSSYQNEIKPESVFLRIETDVRYYSYHYQNSSYNLMACDPKPPQSKETIINIEIFSSKDFNGYHAGTNLASLFVIDDFNSIPYNILVYLAKKPKTEEFYMLSFEENAKPTSGIHQFKIIFTDSKNRVFEMNTEVNFK